MILHGGSTAVPTSACDFPAPIFSAETWAYDDSCAEWRWLDILGGPGLRARHSAVYDPAARRMLVFGGRYRAAATGAYTLYNDLWALDLATETWSRISDGTGAAPRGRSSAAVAFDPQQGRLWLFGGNASQSGLAYASLDDTWSYDLATASWQETPSGRGPALG